MAATPGHTALETNKGPTDEAAHSASVGILFVHGIGRQRKGETLLSFGEPLFDWLKRWLAEAKVNGECNLSLGVPSVAGSCPEDKTPAHWSATLTLPGPARRTFSILAAESWWAEAFPAPTFVETATWARSFVFRFVRLLRSHSRVLLDRLRDVLDAIFQASGATIRMHPMGILLWFATILAALFLSTLVFSWAVFLIVLPIIIGVLLGVLRFLMIVPKVSFVAKLFFIAEWLAMAMAEIIGDACVVMTSHAGLEEMLRQVREDLLWLSSRVDKVIVVSHSQGARLCYEVLADEPCEKLSEFITVGGAVKLLQQDTDENSEASHLVSHYLQANPDASWTNFWATLDPVPAGAIAGTPLPGLRELEVTNFQSLMRDHTSYQQNHDQFVATLAEIIARSLGASIHLAPNDEAVLNAAFKNRFMRTQMLALVRWQFIPIVLAITAGLSNRPLRATVMAWLMVPLGGRTPEWLSPGSSKVDLTVGALLVAIWLGPVVGSAWRAWDWECYIRVTRGDLRMMSRRCALFVAVASMPVTAAILVLLALGRENIWVYLFAVVAYGIASLCFLGLCAVPRSSADAPGVDDGVPQHQVRRPIDFFGRIFSYDVTGESWVGAQLRNLGVNGQTEEPASAHEFWARLSAAPELASIVKDPYQWIARDDRRKVLSHLHESADAACRHHPELFIDEAGYTRSAVKIGTDKQRDVLRTIDALDRIEQEATTLPGAAPIEKWLRGDRAELPNDTYDRLAAALLPAARSARKSRPDLWADEAALFEFLRWKLKLTGMKQVERSKNDLLARERYRQRVPGRSAS